MEHYLRKHALSPDRMDLWTRPSKGRVDEVFKLSAFQISLQLIDTLMLPERILAQAMLPETPGWCLDYHTQTDAVEV